MLLNFGHTIIEPDSRACACGSKGCLQSIAWPPGIVRTALELLAKDTSSRLHGITVPLSSELILEAVYAGDVVAKVTFEQTCVNLINLLNLEMIVYRFICWRSRV